jgi:hypothetical protein
MKIQRIGPAGLAELATDRLVKALSLSGIEVIA